jgi:hypothetical protein
MIFSVPKWGLLSTFQNTQPDTRDRPIRLEIVNLAGILQQLCIVAV